MTLEKIGVNSEKKYSFEGYFNPNKTYKYLINFLENSLNYWDVTEKDFEEKNLDGERFLMSKIEAEKIYSDYFRIIIKYEILMKGNDVTIEDDSGSVIKMTKGIAKIAINSYVQPDWGANRKKNAVHDFLRAVYDKFVGNDELDQCIGSAAGDVGQLMARFKEHMNSQLK